MSTTRHAHAHRCCIAHGARNKARPCNNESEEGNCVIVYNTRMDFDFVKVPNVLLRGTKHELGALAVGSQRARVGISKHRKACSIQAIAQTGYWRGLDLPYRFDKGPASGKLYDLRIPFPFPVDFVLRSFTLRYCPAVSARWTWEAEVSGSHGDIFPTKPRA